MTVRPSSGQNQKSHGTTRGKDYTSDMKLHIVFCLYALLMLSGIQYFSNGRINILFDLYHFLKNHLNIIIYIFFQTSKYRYRDLHTFVFSLNIVYTVFEYIYCFVWSTDTHNWITKNYFQSNYDKWLCLVDLLICASPKTCSATQRFWDDIKEMSLLLQRTGLFLCWIKNM